MIDNENEVPIYCKMIIRSSATLIEIIGGQPLDRLKINYQLPKKYRLPTRQLLKLGPKEFYTASYTSIFQRCILYIPSIYFLGEYYDNNLSLNNNSDNIIKPLFISSIITPQVSLFESLKTDQQVKNIKDPVKHIFKKYNTGGIKNIIPSFTATFLREASFSAGICVIIPIINNKLNNKLNDTNTIYFDKFNKPLLSGMIAGAITQILSQPFDTIKTHQEYDSRYNFMKTTKILYNNDGLLGFFNGGLPRCIRGVWTLGCLSYCTSYLTNKLN